MAARAAPVELRWASMVPELLELLYFVLPCREDRRRIRQVCHHWRVETAGLVRPPLPWLLLPSLAPAAPAFIHEIYFHDNPESCPAHRYAVPQVVLDARAIGSYAGGWIFVATGQWSGHRLLNLGTGEQFPLPDSQIFVPPVVSPMIVLAATLSSPPTQDGCIVAAITTTRGLMVMLPSHVSFWRLGDTVVRTSYFQPGAQDVIFHNGAFCVIRDDDNLDVCTVAANPDGGLELQVNTIRFPPVPLGLAGQRFLVPSRGQLLMAVRDADFSGFSVYQMALNNEGQHAWLWQPDLDGRVLYVGRGCSSSYEITDYLDAFHREGVYFIDDSVNLLYTEGANGQALGHGVPGFYSCNRCGRSELDPLQDAVHFEDDVFFFRQNAGPSNYSPPAWLFI